MRHRTTLPLLLLLSGLVATSAAAQSLGGFATVPADPAPGDQIVLKLSGLWPDGCVPDTSLTSLTRTGTHFRVNFNYSGFSGFCTAAVTAWSLDVPVGSLAAGSYTVEVTRTRTFMPADTIGTASFQVAAVPESTVWLPGFRAAGDAFTLASTLAAYNNTERPATVTYLGAWDALGESSTPAPVTLEPRAAGVLDSRPLRDGQAVQMLSLRTTRRVALRATLERLETVPPGLPKVPESFGRVELPVFTELFPAGMTAVAGDVSLSASECAGATDVRRRVNLTLFNAGKTAAKFVVTSVSAGSSPGANLPGQEFDVPAESLVQFNGLSLESLPVCDAGGAWFRITGDQPFLAYVSTVRPQSLPGVLPYEIFPARIDR